MKILKISDFMIYWAIIMMPFAVGIAPGMANAFIGIFSVFYILKKIVKREGLRVNKWVILLFFLIIAASLLSFINSVNYRASFQGIIKLLKYLLILLVCSGEIRDLKHLKRVVISICCGIVLVSVDAFYQFIFGYDFIHRISLHYNIGMPRVSAAFPNPNILGVYLSALTPLAVGLALLYFKGKKRLLMLIPAALGLSGILLTFSRGAGLAVFIAFLFLLIVGRKKWLIAGLIVLLLLSLFFIPDNIKQWARESNYDPLVCMFNRDRVSIYTNTINMIRQHPFIGVGVNTFTLNYGKYKLKSAEEFCPTPEGIYAHNIYLQMGGETGLLGLTAFILFLFLLFKLGIDLYRKSPEGYLRAATVSLLACIVAFLINGFTETSLYYPRVSMIFWYLAGVSLALSRIGVDEN